jgi:hypothetical protein
MGLQLFGWDEKWQDAFGHTAAQGQIPGRSRLLESSQLM